MMHITSGCHLFDAFEARARQPARQYHMRPQAAVAQLIHRGKDHSDLKADARLRRSDLYRTTLMHQGIEALEKPDGLRALAGEKLLDEKTATGVRHVAHDELPPAFGTGPERTRRNG